MKPEKWFVCCDAIERATLAGMVREAHDHAVVFPVAEGARMRSHMLRERPGVASVLVGTRLADVDPMNLAAALVRDGHAREVVLAARDATPSLMERADRAGISRVIDMPRVSEAARDDRPSSHAAGAVASDGRARAAEGNLAVQEEAAEKGGRPDKDQQAERGRAEKGRRAEKNSQHPAADLVRKPRHLEAAGDVPPHESPILTFASGRGGVGKSGVVAMSALIAARWGMSVALVDLDLAFGNVSSLFGVEGVADLSPLGKDEGDLVQDEVIRLGKRAAEEVSVWGPCARPELAELVEPRVGELLGILSRTHDLVLVDTSPAWSDATAVSIQMADRLVLVADDRAGAISSLSRAAALAVRLGVARTRIVRLMNRCDRKGRDEGFLARADLGLETARCHRVLEGGDEAVELLGLGHAEELAALDNDFPASTATFLAQTLSELGKLPEAGAPSLEAVLPRRRGVLAALGLGREAS